MKPPLSNKSIPLFALVWVNRMHHMWVAKGRHWKWLLQTRPPDLTFPALPKTLAALPTGDVWREACGFFIFIFFVLLFSYLQKKHIFSENISHSAAFWLVFRPPPLLSDGGNKAFPPESSARWRGNGLHSNELFLQASFGSLFFYPLARGTNSKQQPNPWASKIHWNSADLTVRGSPWKSVL